MPHPTPAFAVINAAAAARKSRAFQRGQGMTEYIIIVALIAVAAIGVYQFFGQVVRSQTAAIAKEVGGVDGAGSNGIARAAATATTNETGKKGLDGYTGGQTATAAAGAAR